MSPELPENGIYCSDALHFLKKLPDNSIDLVFFSPPYASIKTGADITSDYVSIPLSSYNTWFMPIAVEIKRVIKHTGSFVLNIDTMNVDGERSLYIFELLISLVRNVGFKFIQDCFYVKPSVIPSGIVVRYTRLKPSVEYVWWFAKNKKPKANARHVLMKYSDSFEKRIAIVSRRHLRGLRKQPSGHSVLIERAHQNHGGSIPVNYVFTNLSDANADWMNKWKETGIPVHPARMSELLAEFWILFLTDRGDIVLDPFAGAGTTLAVAKRLGRRYLGCDISPKFVDGARIRIDMTKECIPDADLNLDVFTGGESNGNGLSEGNSG